MKWPLVFRKTLETQELWYKQQIEKLEGIADERAEEAYQRARSELKAILREIVVDANYEIFNSSDGLVRGRIYAFFSTALSYFHERSEK